MDTNQVQNETVAKIAHLNDAARSNAFNYVATRGIMALKPEVISDIFIRVQGYKDFNADNDPYGEHDFGSFIVADSKIFWKIDYYRKDLRGGIDPLDPECCRVLSIMLAEEY